MKTEKPLNGTLKRKMERREKWNGNGITVGIKTVTRQNGIGNFFLMPTVHELYMYIVHVHVQYRSPTT